jgi:hypothetical protein
VDALETLERCPACSGEHGYHYRVCESAAKLPEDIPRRYRWKNGGMWKYGVFFPSRNVHVSEFGHWMYGEPSAVEWLDG